MASFTTISGEALTSITGGGKKDDDPPVSPETIGCAIGGAAAAELGPAAVAAGCIGGGAIANKIAKTTAADKEKFTKQAKIARFGK